MSIQESIQIQVESRTAVDSIDKITAAFTALLNQVNGVQAATDKINKQIQSFKAPSSSSSETSKMLKEEDSMWKQFYKDRKSDEAAWAAYRKVKQKEASDALKEIRKQEELMWSKRNAEKQGISALKEYNDSLNNTKTALNGADTATKNYRASVQDLASAAKVASEEVKKLSQTTFSKSFGTQEWVSNQEKALRLMTEMNNKVSGQIKKRNADEIAASNQRIKIAEQERQAKETQQTRYLYTVAAINAKSVASAQSVAQKRIKIDADAEAIRQQMLMKRERMELETAQRIAAAQDRIARYASLKNTFAVDQAKQTGAIRDQLSWLDRLKKSLSDVQSASSRVFNNFIKNPFSNPFKKVETGAKDATKEIEKTSMSLNMMMRMFNTAVSFFRNIRNIGVYFGGVFLTAAKAIYDAGLQLNKFRTTMTVVTGSTAAANDELEWLRDTSMKLGMDFQAASVPFAKFAAAAKNMFNRDEIRTIFTEFSKASVALHLTQAEIQGVFYALQQMASKGRVSSEELRRQLGERIPGAMTLAAKSMKMSMQELDAQLKKGAISSQDFMIKYAEEIGKFFEKGAEYAATSTIGALNRLKNVWGFFLQDIADDKAFDAIKNIFNALSDKVVDLRKIMSDSGSRIAVIFNDIAKSIQNISAEDIAGIFESMIESSRMLVSMLPAISANILSIVNEIASLPEYLTSIDAILNRMGGHKIIFSELQGLERYKQIVTDIKKVENETGMSEGRAFTVLTTPQKLEPKTLTDKVKADAEKFRELLEDKGHTLETLNTKFKTTTETANNYANGIVSINDVTGKNIVSMKEAANVIENYENVLSDANFALTKLPEDLQNASIIKTELELKKEALDLANQNVTTAEKDLATARAKSALYENQVSHFAEMNRLGIELDTEQKRAFTEAGNAANTLIINTEKRVAANAQLAKAQRDYNEELQKSIDKVNSLSLGQRKLLAQVVSLSDKAEDALTVAPTITDDQAYITRLNQLAQTRIALDDLYQKELEYKKLLSGKQLSEGQLDKYRTQIQEASAAQGNLLRDQSTLQEQLKEYSIDAQKYAENLKDFFNAQNAKSATSEIENQYTLFKEQLDIIELQQGAIGKVNALAAFRTKAEQETASLNERLLSQTETRTALEASLNSLQKQREEIIKSEGLESLKLIELDRETLATQKIINDLNADEVQQKKESNKWVELSNEAEKERLKTVQQLALAYAGIVYDNQRGFQSLVQGDYNTELDTWYNLYEAIGKTKDEIKKVYEEKRLIEFFNEAGLSVNALSESLAEAFTSIIKDGGSFMDKLGDMWDAMIDRMLEASMRLVMDNAFALLTSWGEKGSWAQLGLGLVGVGASYLFGGSSAPSRSDIKESRTTTSGDDRAVGYLEMVASDIASRDYYYAKQLEAFQDLQFNLKATANAVVNAVQLSGVDIMGVLKDNVASPIVDTLTSVVPSSIKSAFNSVTGGISSVFKNLFPSAIANVAGVSTATATQALSYSPATTINSLTGQVTSLAEMSPTANALTGDLSSPKIESSAVDNLGTLVSVVGAAYSIYSLISSWGDLNTSQKIVGSISTLSSIVSASAQLASAAINAGIMAVSAATTAVLNAIPVVGWVIAGILNLYQSIELFAKGNIGQGLGQLFTGGVDSFLGDLFGMEGGIFGSVFGNPKTPKISMNTLFTEWIGGAEPPAGSGDLKYKPTAQDPDLLYAKKQGRLATVTPFGRVTLEPRHFKNSESDTVEMFGPILKAIDSIDTQLYESIKSIDLAKGQEAVDRWGRNVGETMSSVYDIWVSRAQKGQYFTQKQKAKDVDMATFLASRYAYLSDLLAETGTAIGLTFDNWFDELQTEWGAEHTLSITQALAAALPILIEFPTELELEKLVTDSLKAPEFGGTPDQAMEEILKVVLSYTALSEGLKGLGATDISEQEIVGFLSHMNSIGFAVEEASQSIFEYGIAMAAMGENVSQGVRDLIEYGKAQDFTNTQFSNFITSAGAFVSLGQALNLSAPLENLAGFAKIVGDLAKNTLDQAELKSLEDQAVEYGGLTVTEARAEIEKLGLATADAILEVSNNLLFLNQSLEIAGSSMADMGHTLLSAVEFSQAYVASFESFEDAQQFVTDFTNAIYSDFEIAEAIYRQTSQAANNLLDTLGLSGLAFDDFKAAYEEVLPTLTDPAILKTWQEAGIAIGQATAAQRQYNGMTDALTVELLQAQGRQLEAVAIQRERELEVMDKSLAVIKQKIYAEQDLNQVRSNAESRVGTQQSLMVDLLNKIGRTSEATQLQRNAVLTGYQNQKTSDIAAAQQSVTSILQSYFADFDAQPISEAVAENIRSFFEKSNITTVEGMYNAAMTQGVNPLTIGQAYGLSGQETASMLSEAGLDISSLFGGAVFDEVAKIEDTYQWIDKLQKAIWDLEDAANPATDRVAVLGELLDQVNSDQLTEFQKSIKGLNDSFKDYLKQAVNLGASEADIENIFAAQIRQVNKLAEDLLKGLKEKLADLQKTVANIRFDIQQSIADIKLDMTGVKDLSIMNEQINYLYESLANTSDANQRINIINDLKSALVSRYNAEKEVITSSNKLSDVLSKISSDFDSIFRNAQNARKGIASSILNVSKSGTGFDGIEYQNKLINELYSRLGEATASDQIILIEELGRAIEDRYNLEIENLQKIDDLLIDIGDFVDELKVDESLTPLTNAQQLSEAQTQFKETLALAQGGDVKALTDITGKASTFLDKARVYFASSPEYTSIFNEVTSALEALTLPEQKQSFEELQTSLQSETIQELINLNDSLDTIISTQTDALVSELRASGLDESKIQMIVNALQNMNVQSNALFAGAGTGDFAGLEAGIALIDSVLATLFETNINGTSPEDIKTQVSTLAGSTIDALTDLTNQLDMAFGEASSEITTEIDLITQQLSDSLAEITQFQSIFIAENTAALQFVEAALWALDENINSLNEYLYGVDGGSGLGFSSTDTSPFTLTDVNIADWIATNIDFTAFTDEMAKSLYDAAYSNDISAERLSSFIPFSSDAINQWVSMQGLSPLATPSTTGGYSDISTILNAFAAGSGSLGLQGLNAVTQNTLTQSSIPETIISDANIQSYVDTQLTNGFSDEAFLNIYNSAKMYGVSSERLANFIPFTQDEILNWVNAMGLPVFAQGGITSGLSIAGEMGPEAIVPLPDGRSIPVTLGTGLEDKLEEVAERVVNAILFGAESTVSELRTSSDKTSKSVKDVSWDKKNMVELV